MQTTSECSSSARARRARVSPLMAPARTGLAAPALDLASYDDMLRCLYGCGTDAVAWRQALAAVAGFFGARQALIASLLQGPGEGGFHVTHELAPQQLAAWSRVELAGDPYRQALQARQPLVAGAVFAGADLVSPERLRCSPLYRDVMAPWGMEQLCLGVVIDGCDGRASPTGLFLFRAASDPPFDPAEQALLQRLLAHLAHALALSRQQRDAAALRHGTAFAAIDPLPRAVVLLDAQGGVCFSNRAAQAFLQRADKVRLVADGDQPSPRLLPVSPQASVQIGFQRALRTAVLSSSPGDSAAACTLVLPDAQGKPACAVHIAPLRLPGHRGLDDAAHEPRAMVSFCDLQPGAEPAFGAVGASLLCRLFRMTPAEARAAVELLAGGTAGEMAGRLGVSVSTFKTQLQAAYAKSRTRGQAELLRLLLSLNG